MKQNIYEEREKINASCVQARSIIKKYFPEKEFDILHFSKNDPVFHSGNISDGFYIIISGTVKVCMGSNGKEQILKIAIENDYLGYECLMKYPKFCTSAIALTDTKVLFVTKGIFESLVKTKPELAYAFAEILCSLLIRKDQKFADLSFGPVRGRLADALLELEIKFKDKDSGTIMLTRSELASYIGSVRETTTKMLSEFKKEKIVETEGEGIRVLNRNKLIAIRNLYR